MKLRREADRFTFYNLFIVVFVFCWNIFSPLLPTKIDLLREMICLVMLLIIQIICIMFAHLAYKERRLYAFTKKLEEDERIRERIANEFRRNS